MNLVKAAQRLDERVPADPQGVLAAAPAAVGLNMAPPFVVALYFRIWARAARHLRLWREAKGDLHFALEILETVQSSAPEEWAKGSIYQALARLTWDEDKRELAAEIITEAERVYHLAGDPHGVALAKHDRAAMYSRAPELLEGPPELPDVDQLRSPRFKR